MFERINSLDPADPPDAPTLDDVRDSFAACVPVFHALGDPFRQQIVMLLAEHERLNVTALAERITLSRPAISHHLKVLKNAGLVAIDRVSRENHYRLTVEHGLAQLRRLVEQAEVSCI